MPQKCVPLYLSLTLCKYVLSILNGIVHSREIKEETNKADKPRIVICVSSAALEKNKRQFVIGSPQLTANHQLCVQYSRTTHHHRQVYRNKRRRLAFLSSINRPISNVGRLDVWANKYSSDTN
ncbi:Uncharacterized protein APZ42_015480 [Daphnia magna]|uniref:Secreted protein n=1 Tax=Daphnia magna TaxID=35525 RepID=A0A162PJ20_9CRUS|nr:Uncharacterized protein APZ42_015480 [Daphnia magna]